MTKTTLSTMLFFSLIVLVAVALAGCLSVDKTGDKTVYAKGDTIVFTITVTNPTPTTVENVNLVDYPPAKITMGTTTVNIGNMAPGATVVSELTGTADEEGCELQNNVIATGSIEGQSNLNGGDTFTFLSLTLNLPLSFNFETLLNSILKSSSSSAGTLNPSIL